MNNNPLLALKAIGQHVWLDNLSRTLLREGALQRLIHDCGIDGVTSNPAIFEKALAGSPYYREDMALLQGTRLDAEARYEALVIPDIQAACDILLPAYADSDGDTGYVSLEVSPALADDMVSTVAAALRLRRAVARDNLLIKVPGTAAGVRACEELTALGLRVNVTLIFSLVQYEAVAQAYLRGAARWLATGGNPAQLRSVASVFLSRVDTRVDACLEALGDPDVPDAPHTPIAPSVAALQGLAGVALAKICHARYRQIFHGPDFAALAEAGVRPQTLLWASTGSKDPASSEVRYVEPLIGAESITTLPDATLAAFHQHGHAASTLTDGVTEAQAHFGALAVLGIDLTEIGESLQADGVRLFAKAFEKILASL